ncbi:hypothetical protein [Pectobacterium versatile]|uniref:hypothetical protein n=1 Tax=Pectobacterium versatile TaxID=2488639 RepID=UPI001F2EA66E|nr:hypothetical protein [Pectobacterium versatile]
MKEIFFTRSGGRTRKILAVYSDGKQYKLNYIILYRTNPTQEEKLKGEKEKRIETLNKEYFIDCGDKILLPNYPLPELTKKFLNFLNNRESHNDNE